MQRGTSIPIELFESQDYFSKIRQIEAITRRELGSFSDSHIKEIRIMGGCVCIKVHDPAILKGYQAFVYQNGVFSFKNAEFVVKPK